MQKMQLDENYVKALTCWNNVNTLTQKLCKRCSIKKHKRWNKLEKNNKISYLTDVTKQDEHVNDAKAVKIM